MNSYFDLDDQLHIAEPDLANQAGLKIVWVPSRWVSVLRVFVPGKSRHQWLEAMPYAIEEQLAQPLEALHLVVLNRDKQGMVTVAVVAKQRMQAWLSALAESDLKQAWLVPECFSLDYTNQEHGADSLACWVAMDSMIEPHSRLVRTGRYSGLSIDASHWAAFVQSAQAQMPALVVEPASRVEVESISALRRFNLCQGEFAPFSSASRQWRPWRWPAGLAALWLILLGVQTHWQTQQTLEQAQVYQQQTETLFRQLFPQTQRVVNIQVQTQSFLNQSSAQAAQVSPVQILSLLESAMGSQTSVKAGRMEWQNQRLSLSLSASNTEQLEQFMSKLNTNLPAGLSARLQVQNLTANQVEGVLHVNAN